MIATLIAGCLSSCTEDNDSSSNGKGGVPKITSVSKTAVYPAQNGIPETIIDSVTTLGFAGESFIIRGTGFSSLKKVYFNDFDTYFNPTLVTDTVIIVTINRETPYADVSNQLKIVTANGSATFDFVVGPPAPLVNSFNPINAHTGDVVTIYGSFFLDPSVTFGTTPATIISSTLTEIKVTVPAGSDFKYVSVKTISGSGISTQAVGTAIYDDAPAVFVENYLGPWDGSGYTVNTATKVQGESSIEATFTGYTGFKFPMYATPVVTAPYKALRMSFKSTKATGKFLLVLNNSYATGKEVSFTSNWTTVIIPLSELGPIPESINEIVLQEYANAGGDKIYIDDIGFVLK